MVKVENLINSVLSEDSHHPDLLSLDETSSSVVHTVLSDSVHEARFQLVSPRFVHVLDFLFILNGELTWGLFHLDEDRGQHTVVLLEENIHFIEESHTSHACLDTVFVSLNDVFLRSVNAVNQK